MICYIDFEANGVTQTEEIISIGAIAEDGRTFYSLVRPHAKLDRKIKELTGIPQEQAEVAPAIEQVMNDFYHWIYCELNCEPCSFPKFYVYGHSDKQFIRGSATLTEDTGTKERLGKLCNSLEDVSKRVAKKFGRESIGLRSAYLTMRLSTNEAIDPQHNALQDAEMLKYVWENLEKFELPEGISPIKVHRINMSYGKKKKYDPKYMVEIKAWHDSKIKGHREWIFPNVAGASGIISCATNKKRRLAAMNKVLKACETGKPINGRYFAFVEQKD